MANEWPAGRLGDLTIKLGSGATPRGGADVYLDQGVALIRSQNVYDDRFAMPGLAFISDEAAERLSNVAVSEGDVLVNITGDSVARINRAPQEVLPARVNQHVAIVRPMAGKLDSRFLHAVLVAPSMKARLLSLASAGATRKALTKGMLADLEVPIPPLLEQRAIASVLGALDDKIESNLRLADAATLMWIEPANRVFRLGSTDQVPVSRLIADGTLAINDGYRAKNAELAEAGIPFLRAGNLTANGLDLAGAGLVPPEVVARAGSKVSAVWDTAFTSKGTVGRITLIEPPAEPSVYSPQVCFWRSVAPSKLSPFLLHAWMRSARFTSQIDAVKGQTDMADYVSLRDQRLMQMDLPDPAQQAEVNRLAEPMARLAATLRREARTLTAIRDALLPKLVSGKIRIPLSDDPGEQVGATVEGLSV